MGKDMLAHGLASQLLAGLYMLKDCIDRCPEREWHEDHKDRPFVQVVFHALFDCDYHLCDNDAEFKEQIFHRENRASFGDYEELEDRIPAHLPERDFIDRYHAHCREKVVSTLRTKTSADLVIPNADVRRTMTKLERYVNLIRHLQHHTAQLGLRLQYATGKEMEWIARGYAK
jgi:hypothetical protein